MNSFTTMAQNRRQLNAKRFTTAPPLVKFPMTNASGWNRRHAGFGVEQASRLLNPASRRIWAKGKHDGRIPLL
jgi:hypothetical protein